MQINENNYVDKAEETITRLSKKVDRRGNIIPFIYHVLGTNAIIKGFMQYVVVVCFIRAGSVLVKSSAFRKRERIELV